MYDIGTAVRITDARTPIGSNPLGSGRSEFVGKTGTITSVTSGKFPYRIKFDDESLGNYGTWSHNALDLADAPVAETPAPAPVASDEPIVQSRDQRLEDFVVGGLARVMPRFGHASDLTVGQDYRVTALHPLNAPGSGTVSIEGHVNTSAHQIGEPGTYGHLVFAPVPNSAPVEADDQPIAVGDRVTISYGHGWDGPGTVLPPNEGSDLIRVKRDECGRTGAFDSRHIRPLTEADDQPIAVGDRVMVTAAAYVPGLPSPGVVVAIHPGSIVGDTPHPYNVALDADTEGAIWNLQMPLHASAVERIAEDDGLDADNLTGMDLGQGDDDEVTATLMDGTVVRVGDTVRINTKRFDWEPGGIHHGGDLVITSIAPRHSGGWYINSHYGYEWFDGIPADDDDGDEVESLREALADASEEGQRAIAAENRVAELEAERTTLTQAASDERRRLCDEIDAIKVQRDEALQRNNAQSLSITELYDRIAELKAENADLARDLKVTDDGLEYAIKILPTTPTQDIEARITGFMHGIRQMLEDQQD